MAKWRSSSEILGAPQNLIGELCMFLPGHKLLEDLYNNPPGLWFLRPDNVPEAAIIAKLPMPVLKAINYGAQCNAAGIRRVNSFLLVSVLRVEQSAVVVTGLRVDDDGEDPFGTMHTLATMEEVTLLGEILSHQRTRMHFFDERARPMLSADCFLAASESSSAVKGLANTAPHYAGQQRHITDRALDMFEQDQQSLLFGKLATNGLFTVSIPLSIQPKDLFESYEITEHDALEFQLDGDDGKEHEKDVYHILASVFGENCFLNTRPASPSRPGEPDPQKEFTDVLGFDSRAICLVEAKALAVQSTEPVHHTNKWNRSLRKDLEKALRQLKGACRNLEFGTTIYNTSRKAVTVPRNNHVTIHAIAVVSDLYHTLDWRRIAAEIAGLSNAERRVYYHVLDLLELQNLAFYSRSSEGFDKLLRSRWATVKASGTALVRVRFRG